MKMLLYDLPSNINLVHEYGLHTDLYICSCCISYHDLLHFILFVKHF